MLNTQIKLNTNQKDRHLVTYLKSSICIKCKKIKIIMIYKKYDNRNIYIYM